MSARQVVVDGSNIATEGRSLPSLAQLDEAVREFVAENPGDVVTVVVDASFGHRVDPSELPTFEEAEAAGEIVSPPAGAIGRGDAFLLRIAEKVGATVLSNDSFQEFHGEHPWLFEKGRLIGGKPVPGVGWIFMDRSPVRGQKSREVVKEAKRKKKSESAPEPSGLDLASSRAKGRDKKLDRAIARATQEVIEPKDAKRSKRRRAGTPPADPVNEPLPFITFIAAHPLGSDVVGVVSEFSSHGAFIEAYGARCYIPLSAMGDPPPRRAREVLAKGEERPFVVQALDPPRRGIELALPGFAQVAGSPTAETVEAEIHPVAPAKPRRKRGTAAASKPAPVELDQSRSGDQGGVETAAPSVAAKRTATKKAAARKAPVEKAAAKKAPAPKASAGKVAAKKLAKKAAAKKAPAEKAPAKKVSADDAPVKKSPVKKASAKKPAAKTAPAENAPPQKASSEKAAAPRATGDEPPAKTAPAKKAPAKKAPVKKAAATRGAAEGASAKKAAPPKAPAEKAATTKASANAQPGKAQPPKRAVAAPGRRRSTESS